MILSLIRACLRKFFSLAELLFKIDGVKTLVDMDAIFEFSVSTPE